MSINCYCPMKEAVNKHFQLISAESDILYCNKFYYLVIMLHSMPLNYALVTSGGECKSGGSVQTLFVCVCVRER